MSSTTEHPNDGPEVIDLLRKALEDAQDGSTPEERAKAHASYGGSNTIASTTWPLACWHPMK